MKSTRKSLGLLVVGLLMAPMMANADNVLISGFVFNPPKPITTTDSLNPANNHTDSSAGELTGLLNGNSFLTYSTDLAQSFAFNTSYNDYAVVAGVAAWGATKSADLDRALSNVLAFGQPTNNVQSAAIQSIIWEIIYEQAGNPYNLGAGTFIATSSDAATQTLLNSINWGALPATPITHHADKLYSREQTDFLVLTQVQPPPVPEPGSLALLGLGLAGLVTSRRRKQ